jgi:hypothetical protein
MVWIAKVFEILRPTVLRFGQSRCPPQPREAEPSKKRDKPRPVNIGNDVGRRKDKLERGIISLASSRYVLFRWNISRHWSCEDTGSYPLR